MLPPIQLKPEEHERLKIAHEKKKYGHLMTWKELYLFQSTIANFQQLQEIATFARRKNRGENITLPLLKYLSEQIKT